MTDLRGLAKEFLEWCEEQEGTQPLDRVLAPRTCVKLREVCAALERLAEVEGENENHRKVRTCVGCGGYLCPPLCCYGCQKLVVPNPMVKAATDRCDELLKREDVAQDRIAKLEAALRRWTLGREHRLHPIAAEALGRKEET